jgi:hypothetical protein
MGRNQEIAHGLSPSTAGGTLQKIRSCDHADNPTPEALRSWVNDEAYQFKQAVVHVDANAERTSQLSENTRLEALAVRTNAIDFVECAEVAADLLDGVTAGRVSNAFLEGVRIGMLHERILSLIDGRFRERWVQQDRRKSGAAKANAKKAKSRPDYVAAVKEVMATGVKYHPACEIVAAELGPSKKTVENHTPELAPGWNRKNA